MISIAKKGSIVSALKFLSTYILGNFLFFISFLIPKNNYVWIFGAWGGKKYADNSRYLFEYVNKYHSKIRAVWISNDSEILKLVKSKNFEAYHPYSLKGIMMSSRAKVAIVSNGMIDINRFTCARQKIVQQWHGIPLKQQIYCDEKIQVKSKLVLKRKLSYIFPFLKRDIDFEKAIVVASSPEVKQLYKKVFRTENVKITGFPRTDAFFLKNNRPKICEVINSCRRRGYIPGIYMPTYRRESEFDILKFLLESVDCVSTRLEQKRLMLFLKLHSFQSQKEFFRIHNKNLYLIGDEEIDHDIYSVLSDFEFLITDYSSILFDYLILDKPIIFAPFDLESYIKSNGMFLYDYEQVTFEPRGRNWQEVMDGVEEIIANPDKQKEKRNQLKEIFHKYTNGNSCERLFNVIKKDILC